VNPAHYDPELPFLLDLERQLRLRAEHAARRPAASPRQPRRAERSSLRVTMRGRMVRRTAILGGLLCLLAASALGARSVLSTTTPSPLAVRQGAFVLVASGARGRDSWTLRLYERGGQLCRAFVVAGAEESSRCAPAPSRDSLGVSTLESARYGYLFGVTGLHVHAVGVRIGASMLTVATRPLAGARAAAAGLPHSARYFVAIATRLPGAEEPPASVTALDPRHRPLGGTQVACLQEAGPPPCGP